ncbi:MAG: serpin family protein [Desulfobacterales bacterium]|nr:serpin family protein [Desulfobacterales bacterium]
MKIILISFALILVMPIYMSGTTAEARQDTNTLVKGNNAFAINIYNKLKHKEGNLFFSPYSISTALAMTYAGARNNTAKQMAQTLRFTLVPDQLHPAFASIQKQLNAVKKKGNIQLSIANALWPHKDYPFLQDFLALTKKYYGVSIISLDYNDTEASRKTINTWVEKKTENKITELLQKGILNELTRLVLVNAIYFKGNWMQQFNKRMTADAPFRLSPGKSVQVPMMNQNKEFPYKETENLQILELPYIGNELSMIVLLPKEINGLPELENNLTADNVDKWTNGLINRELRVFLPKFKMTSQFKLKDTLKSMGMTDAFDMNKADFSGMDGKKHWLYIGAVIHKAFIDVNEEGSEAAAATAVVMKVRSAVRSEPPVFRADHPFVFLIRDNISKSILFFGRVKEVRSEK